MNAKLSRREFTTGLAGIVVYFSLAPDSLRERAWTDRVRWARLGAMIR